MCFSPTRRPLNLSCDCFRLHMVDPFIAKKLQISSTASFLPPVATHLFTSLRHVKNRVEQPLMNPQHVSGPLTQPDPTTAYQAFARVLMSTSNGESNIKDAEEIWTILHKTILECSRAHVEVRSLRDCVVP
jgi:hypothetical protein